MITGLNFDVTTDELETHCNFVIEHHREKVEFYQAKLDGMKDLLDVTFDRGTSMNQDPRKTFEDKVKEHRDKISGFTFIRDHLIPNETYRLDGKELRALDLISSGSFGF